MKPALSVAFALLFAAAGAPSASPAPEQTAPAARSTQAETAKPSFPAAVELVTVDAGVVDKMGKALAGFGKEDFVITDNGVPQTITSFEAVVVPEAQTSGAPAARRARFSTNAAEARRARTFLVVFDDIHLTPAQALRAKGAVAEFLRSGAAEGDRVTLIATGGAAWWNARMPEGRDQLLAILKRLDGRYIPDSSPDRLTEYEAMRIEEYQDQQVADKVQRRFDSYGAVYSQKDPRGVKPPDADSGGAVGIIPELIRSRAQEVHNLSTSRNKITLGVMTRAIEALAGIKGRKAMILVSQGFVYDVQVEAMKKVVEASTRANVPIYFIDTRGLQALPEAFTAAFGRPLEAQDTVAVLADITLDAAGAEAISLDTGGFPVKNSNDLVNGIKRVSNESRAYYLLGYVPSDLRRDGKFRKIEVRLKGPRAKGLTVRARRGYYAPLEGAATAPKTATEKKDPLVARALDSPFEMEDVPLRVSAFVFDEAMLDQLSVTVAAEIDVRRLAFKEEDGRFKDSVAFLIEAQHRETGEYYRYDQTIEMSLLPETRRRLERTWYPAAREFTLPAGGYQAKVVVRDLGSGRVGSVTHDFEVPAVGSFRVSTPVLSDALVQGEGGIRRPVLQVRRAVPKDAVLWCQFSVYGAAKDEKGSLMPQVSAGYEIRRADGMLFRREEPSRIAATSVGALLRLKGIPLRGAPPGEYEIDLTVRDELAGKVVEVREPFVVEAEGPVVSSQ
jgi:VWFA-related protein